MEKKGRKKVENFIEFWFSANYDPFFFSKYELAIISKNIM